MCMSLLSSLEARAVARRSKETQLRGRGTQAMTKSSPLWRRTSLWRSPKAPQIKGKLKKRKSWNESKTVSLSNRNTGQNTYLLEQEEFKI